MRRKTPSFERQNARNGFIFIGFWLFGCIALFIYPVIVSLILSFSDPNIKGAFTFDFAGLVNYKKAFLTDIRFIPNFLNSIQTMLTNMPLIIVFSLFIAILLNRNFKGRSIFREIFFLPVLIGSGLVMQELLRRRVDVQAIAMARDILMPENVMTYLGPKFSDFINRFLSAIMIVLWKSGVQILLFLSGLQTVSSQLYEAAYVDGATEWEKFWKITLPMLTPTIFLVIVYTMVDNFTDVTNSMLNYILYVLLNLVDFKYASAMGWMYFSFILVMIGLIYLIIRPFMRQVSE